MKKPTKSKNMDRSSANLAAEAETPPEDIGGGAIDQNAIGFYEQFGFQRLSDDQRRLFLPLCQIKN